MAASDAKPVPIKGEAYRITFPLFDADGDLVSGAAGLDSEVSKDAGTYADCTNEATEIAASSGTYYLDLTATEMNADTVALLIKTSTSGAKTTVLVIYPASATRGLAGTALPAAAADAAGGLPISDAGALDLDVKLAHTEEITVARMGALTDWINGGRLDLLIDAIKAKTDPLPTDPADESALEDLISALDTAVDAIGTIVTNLHDTDLPAVKADTAEALTRLPDATPGASGGVAIVGSAMALTAAERTAAGARTVGPATLDGVLLTILAVVLAKTSGASAAASTIVIRNIIDTANLASVMVDEYGNRTTATITWANA